MRHRFLLAIFAILHSTCSFAQTSNCLPDLYKKLIEYRESNTLRQAKIDNLEFIRKSKNFKPVYEYIWKNSTATKTEITSSFIPGIGSFKLLNDLHTGQSTLNWLGTDGVLKEVLVDGSHLGPKERFSRVESIAVDKNSGTVYIRYRNYREDNKPYLLHKFKLKGVSQVASEDEPEVVIRNYAEISNKEMPSRKISLRTFGVSGSTDVVSVGPSGEENLLYSTYFKFKNNRHRIESIDTSPDQRFLVVRTADDGNIDRYENHIFDGETGKPLRTLVSGSQEIKWNGPIATVQSPAHMGKHDINKIQIAAKDPKYKWIRKYNPDRMEGDGVGIVGDHFVFIAKDLNKENTEIKAISTKAIFPGDGKQIYKSPERFFYRLG